MRQLLLLTLFLTSGQLALSQSQDSLQQASPTDVTLSEDQIIPPPPPPPPTPHSNKKHGFVGAEIMPRPKYKACEALSSRNERERCSREKMFATIYDNLVYPKAAQAAGVEGTVVINFIITKEGKMKEFKILKSLGYGCDEEALRVLQLIEDWVPTSNRATVVPQYFNMPIKFRLAQKE